VTNQSITIEELWRLKDFQPNPSQKAAFDHITALKNSGSIFKHIIIDEYQGSKNICVVGDDDQALYRFRGADGPTMDSSRAAD
jgi:superfamily I DNA/RNA helicase